jgi:MerR family redox-sensitive transcriptional activator SoxR
MEDLTIGEVARRAGIQSSAIRYYESRGLLPPAKRVNKHRRYDSGVLDTLSLLQLAKEAGFTLSEIKTLFYGFEPDVPPSARWQALAARKLVEVEALIRRAEGMKHLLQASLKCGCLRLEDCRILLGEERRAQP